MKRPLRVTILAIGVLIIAFINLIRLAEGIRLWDYWAKILPISPYYLPVSGLVWCVIGIVVGFSLLTGKRWAPALTLISIFAFVLYAWTDRLYIAATSVQRTSILFSLILTLVLLFSVIILFTRPKIRHYFGASHGNR